MYKATRRLLALAAMVMATVGATADIPEGYYSSLKGKKGAELKTAVYNIIKSASVLSYGSGSGSTWSGFYKTDRLDDNSVVDRYSNDVRYFSSSTSAIDGMNIEHSFPKSWWGGTKTQAYKDLYNLMPCEEKINSSKSNYPMGEVTTVKTTNDCTKIGTGSQGYYLWEPADKWKGDFARGYMYMATCYQNYTWSGTQALQILENNTYPTLQKWACTLYIKWAKADRPDQLEMTRNDAVYDIQGNRNPFVDFPNLMEYIWGDSTDVAFNPATTMRSTDHNDGNTPEPSTQTIYNATFTSADGSCTESATTLPSGLSNVWTRSSSYGWKGTAYYSKTNHAADSRLVTPEIDLTGYSSATLTFSHACNFFNANAADMCSVEVTCDGETTTLGEITWPTTDSWTFYESGDISLSEFAGKKITIAFHYTSTSSVCGTWEIKSMEVTGEKEKTGISTVTTGHKAGIDWTQPYEVYTLDGRRVSPQAAKGLVIVRQKDKCIKAVW